MKKRYAFAADVSLEKLLAAGFKPGYWLHKDDHDRLNKYFCLTGDIELYVDVDLTTGQWDDFTNALVIDDNFGQPYTPFYKDADKPFPFLERVIERYNNAMDSLVKEGILVELEN